MTRGRKPLSNEVKALRGTAKPSRATPPMTGKQLTQVPPPPGWLAGEAQTIFRKVCEILILKKRLFEEDLQLVAAYSNESATYTAACEKLNDPENNVQTTATGYQQISPWLTVKNQALKSMQSIGASLGLDPFARVRLGDKPENTEPNIIEQIRMKYGKK